MEQVNKQKRGRKKAKPIDLLQLETMAANGLSKDQCAHCLGIAPRTFFKMQAEDPAIEEAYAKGKSQGIRLIANSLFKKAIEGDTTSMIFFLKAQAGWRDAAQIEINNGVNVEGVRKKLLDALEKNARSSTTKKKDIES